MEIFLERLEIEFGGNFNVLLLRRRGMSSVNAVRSRLSLLLVGQMLLPSVVTILTYQISNEEMLDDGRMDSVEFVLEGHSTLVIPESSNPSHGWKGDSGNVGEAALFYRTATYVPIGEWEDSTGNGYMSGSVSYTHLTLPTKA